MRKSFDAELLELGAELTNMANQVGEALDIVTDSLNNNDESKARQVMDMMGKMGRVERDIEDHSFRLLLLQQPVARDLRAISAAMKMVSDLQRIADQASNIAEISLILAKQGGMAVPSIIGEMGKKASLMVHQAILAYTGRDVEMARAVINLDDEVDELFDAAKREMIDYVITKREHADQGIDYIIIAKYLERIADHAVNIANWAIFCVTGEVQVI